MGVVVCGIGSACKCADVQMRKCADVQNLIGGLNIICGSKCGANVLLQIAVAYR